MIQGQGAAMNQYSVNSVFRGNHGGRGRNCSGGSSDDGGRTPSPDSEGGHWQFQNSEGGHRLTYQICGKVGHVVLKFYHRFNHSYQTEDACVAAAASTQSNTIDANWYMDTRATDHITNDLDRLTMNERYIGKDQVHVANSVGMLISHIGHSKFHTPQSTLSLNNILHVPKAPKHLLSVHKFSKDNNAFFEFDPNCFLVKDRATKTTLLRGRCEGGLYPFLPNLPSHGHAPKSIFSSTKPTQDRWHCHLGHPSSSIIQHVVQQNSLSCSTDFNKTVVCDACQQGKSHQLPYHSSNSVSSSPLELVYYNVWGPTPISVGGFKYYIASLMISVNSHRFVY